MIEPSRASVIALLCVNAFGACSKERKADNGTTRSPAPEIAQVSPLDAVQRVLQVAPEERAYLDSLVRAIHDRFYGPPIPIRGEIHRLGPSGTRRYLLVASIPRPGTENVIRFFVAEPKKNLSAPSPMLISDEIDRFAVDTLGDFDGDGLADVGYCIWSGARGTPGSWSAVGFRADAWYQIKNTPRARRCEPQAEP